MKRYEIYPVSIWKNSVTGATASITGAHPGNGRDDSNWSVVETGGYGYTDLRTGTRHSRSGESINDVETRLRRFLRAGETISHVS